LYYQNKHSFFAFTMTASFASLKSDPSNCALIITYCVVFKLPIILKMNRLFCLCRLTKCILPVCNNISNSTTYLFPCCTIWTFRLAELKKKSTRYPSLLQKWIVVQLCKLLYSCVDCCTFVWIVVQLCGLLYSFVYSVDGAINVPFSPHNLKTR